ncbi:hypothetical protein Ait01nite_097210 [Actinoplanes italicus]|uniref:Uncharacterized protein DUF742 n=1 Tax=Actinoplanes italicus TaxID=113567 RepID=A0A2T0JLF3_9ACTN|nr:DUF742 domain-containing protein [Actinoplanes italicus]PRX08440.1 uncharacterized protein DUF742 [Actinoplanes italicus]GIE36676.1 hypothetical protein Ait01nite_097210 [Actinoplanes italicus]
MIDGWDGDDETATGGFLPLYILVNGRTTPRNSSLDLATQVIAIAADVRRLEPEYLQILDRCKDWISIAEIGAYLHTPLTIVKVMVDVLLEQGYLDSGSPAQQKVIDPGLLGAVLAGLERL